MSGVSITTVKTLESSGDRITIRASSLDAILTALAMRGYLGPSEIKFLSEATDRRWESFEDLNFRAEQLKDKSSNDTRTRPTADPTREERFIAAFRLLEDLGQGDAILTMIEALAAQAGAQLANDQRTPKTTKRRSPQTMRVTTEPKDGPVPGTIQQDTTTYEVTPTHTPIHKRPLDLSTQNPDPNQQDTNKPDTLPETGTQ